MYRIFFTLTRASLLENLAEIISLKDDTKIFFRFFRFSFGLQKISRKATLTSIVNIYFFSTRQIGSSNNHEIPGSRITSLSPAENDIIRRFLRRLAIYNVLMTSRAWNHVDFCSRTRERLMTICGKHELISSNKFE